MEIPKENLSQDVLRALAEEFVTREGTDYGHEVDFDKKVESVLAQLASGDAVVTFDPETESASIRRAD